MTDTPHTGQQLQMLDLIQAEADNAPETFRANHDLHAPRLLLLAQALRAELDRTRAELAKRDNQLIDVRAELSQLRGCPEHGHDCEPDDHLDPHAHQ